MTIRPPDNLEDQLQALAEKEGRDVALLSEEAIQLYLDAVAITGLGSDDIAEMQQALLSELPPVSDWKVGDE